MTYIMMRVVKSWQAVETIMASLFVRFIRKDVGGALRCRFLLPSCIESEASEERGPPARLRMDAIAKDLVINVGHEVES